MQDISLNLAEATVCQFSLQADADETYRLAALLSAEEGSRADRFFFPDIARRFIVCRARLRQLLARLIGALPQEIQFGYGSSGKPFLRNKAEASVHFNVSHSGDWAIVGLSQSVIGVDLEIRDSQADYSNIAARVLSSSEAKFWEALAQTDRRAEILRLWVCKEALLKAMGLGIADGLSLVSLPLPVPSSFAPRELSPELLMHLEDDGTCRMAPWIDARWWKVSLFDLPMQAIASVATPATVKTVRWLSWNDG